MNKKKEKKALTKDQQIEKLKKDNLRFQVEILLIFAAFLGLFFFNYNYTIFKVLMAEGYYDTATLDKVYAEALGTDAQGHYLKNFDNTAIELFTERVQAKNQDHFTTLFEKGGLSAEHLQMDTDGKKTNFQVINNDTGCLTLTAFSSSAFYAVKASNEELMGCKNLIIDMRDNSGGVLKYADKMAEMFLPKGKTIATYKYRSKLLTSMPVSKNSNPHTFEHIYILQNEGTASAAEVFVNALKQNLDNVTVVGEKSYGKAVGQTEMKLLGGYGFKATTLQILTPDGSCINHIGISPDIVTENPLEKAKELIAKSK